MYILENDCGKFLSLLFSSEVKKCKLSLQFKDEVRITMYFFQVSILVITITKFWNCLEIMGSKVPVNLIQNNVWDIMMVYTFHSHNYDSFILDIPIRWRHLNTKGLNTWYRLIHAWIKRLKNRRLHMIYIIKLCEERFASCAR